MEIVVFGLTVSSSWGNGHATLWRALARALARRGHRLVFFERDVPYYAAHRDLVELPGGELRLYDAWENVLGEARRRLAGADVAMVTSYCPDAVAAAELILSSAPGRRVFYDLDTPVTLDALRRGEPVPYVAANGLADFDVVLSYTGGRALEELRTRLGARRVAPLYGCVDPDVHRPVSPDPRYVADLSYLGTYAQDRQATLRDLFLEPARRLEGHRFLIGGALYPDDFPWLPNIAFVHHVPPPEHATFYCSSRMTLNVTRRAMAEMGYCPSGRLFEAAACGTPLLSDAWPGLERFFEPGSEILVAASADDVTAALSMGAGELAAVARRARERTLDEHTADRRVDDLLAALDGVAVGGPTAGAARASHVEA